MSGPRGHMSGPRGHMSGTQGSHERYPEISPYSFSKVPEWCKIRISIRISVCLDPSLHECSRISRGLRSPEKALESWERGHFCFLVGIGKTRPYPPPFFTIFACF